MSAHVLEGLSCLVVGGTSGIGLAAARHFLSAGARVVIAGHPADAGALERDRLDAVGSALELSVDLSRAAEVTRMFEAAMPFLGRLDVLLHSAGLSGRRFGDGPLHACTDEGWDHVMQVNARGLFLSNRAAVERMLAQPRDVHGQRGAVLNVGSVVDRSPSKHFDTIAYAASKSAVRAITLGCAARYAADGIRFNLIEPGLVHTPMAARAIQSASLENFRGTKQPLTRGPVLPFDVADAAVYLASPAARAITGATLTIDGGWSVSEGQDGAP